MAAAPKKKPQGASRNAPKGGKASKKPAPGWVWLLVGAALAFFVAFLLHLGNNKGDKPRLVEATTAEAGADGSDQGSSATDQQQPSDKTGANKGSNDKGSSDKLHAVKANGSSVEPPKEPRFDFYTLLPNQKAMPNQASADAANKPSATAAKIQESQQAQAQNPAPVEAPKPAAEPTETASADKAIYFLQAGSFKNESEADNRRASILMNGLPVKIQTIHIKEGQTWYRVVVGPMKSKQALESARATLHAQGVDTVTLKQG